MIPISKTDLVKKREKSWCKKRLAKIRKKYYRSRVKDATPTIVLEQSKEPSVASASKIPNVESNQVASSSTQSFNDTEQNSDDRILEVQANYDIQKSQGQPRFQRSM
ncbi:hypothetical protein TSUD_42370 [Trifolium subterraneum]|uniref:Uncharacterized protein n=1 Tax=Trifolium subterraneum TaxID=3900 RepID=A0A2Z6LHB6_TRISU|nr:hypothetical protein TSUD_42370 [Trifolium subterraneum]